MTKAPKVNQIRLLSSDALANAPKLMLAASCSAADAICYPSLPKTGRRGGECRPRSGRGGGRPLSFSVRAAGAEDHLAPGTLDRSNGGFGSPGHLDRDRRADLALGQETHAIAYPPQDPGRHEGRAVEFALGL